MYHVTKQEWILCKRGIYSAEGGLRSDELLRRQVELTVSEGLEHYGICLVRNGVSLRYRQHNGCDIPVKAALQSSAPLLLRWMKGVSLFASVRFFIQLGGEYSNASRVDS